MNAEIECMNPLESLDGAWCILENKRPRKELLNTIPSVEIVTTVKTKVIEDYDKDIPRSFVRDDAPPKEFVEIISPTEKENAHSMDKKSSGWLTYILSSLSRFLVTQADSAPAFESHTEKEDPELVWSDWEWVLSKTEEFALLQSNVDSLKIKEELARLRQTAKTIQFRSYFTKLVSPTIKLLQQTPEELNDLCTCLDASKCSKIIHDVIANMEKEWLEFIQTTFFLDPALHTQWLRFRDNYHEKPYERNVVGSLKELAFSAAQAAQTAGLTEKILIDIIWSLWKTLTEVIRTVLEREISYEEARSLADTVSKVKQPLITLWIKTVRTSRQGRRREGQLIEKWKKEKELEQQRLSVIKNRRIDAKYYDEQRQSCAPQLMQSHIDIKSLKSFLEKSLVLHAKRV